jgi:hypothetical protein
VDVADDTERNHPGPCAPASSWTSATPAMLSSSLVEAKSVDFLEVSPRGKGPSSPPATAGFSPVSGFLSSSSPSQPLLRTLSPERSTSPRATSPFREHVVVSHAPLSWLHLLQEHAASFVHHASVQEQPEPSVSSQSSGVLRIDFSNLLLKKSRKSAALAAPVEAPEEDLGALEASSVLAMKDPRREPRRRKPLDLLTRPPELGIATPLQQSPDLDRFATMAAVVSFHLFVSFSLACFFFGIGSAHLKVLHSSRTLLYRLKPA